MSKPMGSRPRLVLTTAGAIALCWPAAFNGYPLVYADTGTYLRQGLELYGAFDRPPYYALLILPLHLGVTLWLIPLAQAALVSWLLLRLVDIHLPALDERGVVLLFAGLAAGSTVPWHAAQVMPDVFTGVVFLTLVVLSSTALDWGRERLFLLAVLCVGLAVHNTHWMLAAGVLVALWVLARAGGLELPRLYVTQIAACILVSLLAFAAYNLALVKRFSIVPMAPLFLLARSLEDGPARAWLRENCPRRDLLLCSELPRIPATSTGFLWRADSPVEGLYRRKGRLGAADEARVILFGALRDHPWWQLSASARNFGLQLVRFAPGDFAADYASMNTSVTRTLRAHFEGEFDSFVHSRQVQGTLPMRLVRRIDTALVIVSLVVAAAFFAAPRTRSSPDARRLFHLTLAAIGTNALITGVFSEPIDRYGSRVIWLVPLSAAVLSLSGRFGEPFVAEHRKATASASPEAHPRS
jgi:hypothetical protein